MTGDEYWHAHLTIVKDVHVKGRLAIRCAPTWKHALQHFSQSFPCAPISPTMPCTAVASLISIFSYLILQILGIVSYAKKLRHDANMVQDQDVCCKRQMCSMLSKVCCVDYDGGAARLQASEAAAWQAPVIQLQQRPGLGNLQQAVKSLLQCLAA